ncbi:MAG: hypothetical protein WEC59_00475, partial [Salibacteraceae bacterium]
LKGKVYPESGLKAPSEMKVFLGNKVVQNVAIKRNGKFKISLISDSYYTLSVSMKDHETKKVVVSTQGVTKTGAPLDTQFDFDVFLYKSDAFAGRSKDLLDFPTALIEYDEYNRSLEVNMAYTSSIYAAQKELLKSDPVIINDKAR